MISAAPASALDFEDGFALGCCRQVVAVGQIDQPRVVLQRVHVEQDAFVGHGDLGGLMPLQERAQAAFAVAGENLCKQFASDQRRMAALAAKGRIDDGGGIAGMVGHQRGDGRSPYERNVDWQQQAGLRVGRERREPGLDARIHALGVIVVANRDDAGTLQGGFQRFRFMAGDDADIGNAHLAESADRPFKSTLAAQTQQRLETAHAR